MFYRSILTMPYTIFTVANTRELGQMFINNNDIKRHFLKEKVQVLAHV